MPPDPATPRGRGSADNPPNRFIPIYHEPDPDCPPEEQPAPATRFYRDSARSIIATNDSPDVGFSHSVNPYRGCEHGCSYCLIPETPILYADLTWRPIGNVQPGDMLIGFDEEPGPTTTRKLRPATVLAAWWSTKPTLRLTSANAEVMTTAEHRWLDARSGRWSRTDTLTPGRLLQHIPVVPDEGCDDDYQCGYLAGLSLGDATFRYEPGWRSNRLGFPQANWRVALVDDEPLQRVIECLNRCGVEAQIRPFSAATVAHKALNKVEIRSLGKLSTVHTLLTAERSSRSYRRGFLAGFFDAEGHNGRSLRISQVDVGILERVRDYARSFGFDFRLETYADRASTIRLIGRLSERLRFFSLCRPAIRRKTNALFGRELEAIAEPVRSISAGPVTDVIDIQTTTGTFIAAGHATHNCYARPYHEYLGLSAGLDFESKIFVKEDAPELLRKELAAKSWVPVPLAFSGVTDCYQPAERTYRLTRRCLEVCAEFRNPVGIVTKAALVARDADILAVLAAHDAAAVFVSVTTLDAELAGAMEPRASRPAARLRAIEELTKAGVPVGVFAAPMIPGLTDHELPAILAAGREAGARFAGYTMLRLPLGVAGLFEQWLERHAPEKKAKVLGRVREMRGGRLNDSQFGRRMRGEGAAVAALHALYRATARRLGFTPPPRLSTAAFRRPGEQSLFD